MPVKNYKIAVEDRQLISMVYFGRQKPKILAFTQQFA